MYAHRSTQMHTKYEARVVSDLNVTHCLYLQTQTTSTELHPPIQLNSNPESGSYLPNNSPP